MSTPPPSGAPEEPQRPPDADAGTPAPAELISRLKAELSFAGMRPELHLPTRASVDLRGKRILLTGASSGIGEAAAEKFAAEGATVIVVARREDCWPRSSRGSPLGAARRSRCRRT